MNAPANAPANAAANTTDGATRDDDTPRPAPAQSRVVREGVTAGIIGALVIAVWFIGIDALRGDLLGTPVTLGTSLMSLFLGAGDPPSRAGAFLGYTAFHFVAFIVVGIIAAWVVNASERAPSALIGFGLLFVVFEIGWLGFTTMLAQGSYGALSWLQVFIANLLAAGAMGVYLWRRHPGLAKRFDRSLSGVPE
jgi:hypothetical protein